MSDVGDNELLAQRPPLRPPLQLDTKGGGHGLGEPRAPD